MNITPSGRITKAGFLAAMRYFIRWVNTTRQGEPGGEAHVVCQSGARFVGAWTDRATTATSVTIGGVRYYTSTAAEGREGRGCCWVLAPAAVAPDDGRQDGGNLRMAFGCIQRIIEHSSRPLADLDADALAPEVFLEVKWHLLPSSSTSAYDPVVLAPVIPAAPARNSAALDLPPMLPASHVMAVELVVLPHPTRANKLVVLPVHDSVYFAVAAGYPGPPLASTLV